MDLRGWVITIVSVVLPAWLCLRYPPQRLGPSEITGLFLAIVGLGLVALARLQLGRAFTLHPEARVLVKTGLYSKIRNPIYIFSAIGLSGLALYFEVPKALLGLLLLVPVQLLRANAERRVLEQKFGEDYRRYRASTWF